MSKPKLNIVYPVAEKTITSNTNLENFFRSGNVNIISDHEGEEINSHLYNHENKLLICGDILDSTVGGGFEQNFIRAEGKINNIKKIYNIRNIAAIVNNSNIHLIFGNRDVNKFKCKFLTKMVSKKKLDIFDNFNKGNIDLSETTTYRNLVSSSIHWKADTKHWYPFWNKNINDHISYWSTPETNVDKYGKYIFLTRFYRIFGEDGSDGTMGAANLLYTIPLELGITIDSARIDDKKYLDYLAFIVLAVFRTMTIYNEKPLDIKLIEDINNIGAIKTLKDTILNGLLGKFYSLPNTSFVSYFNDKKNNVLYIFSHGGITSTMIKEFKVFDNLNPLIKHLNDNKKSLTMSGGNIEFNSRQIIDKIEEVNKAYFNNLIFSFRKPQQTAYNPNKYDYKPTTQMLLTLATSALYKPNQDMQFVLNSTINPGIDEIQNYLFYCSDSNIVQIFGHIPKGFATNIAKYGDSKYKTYLINLDFSQSYKYTSLGGKTICFLFFQKDNIENGPLINSSLDITQLVNNRSVTTDINPTETNTNKFITDTKINGNILTLLRNLFDVELMNYDEYIPKDIEYKYHGLFTDANKIEYYVFTTLNRHYKILVIKRKINKQQSAKDKYYKYKMKYLKLKMSLNNQN